MDNSFFLNSTVCFPPVSGGGMIAVLKTAVEIGQGGKACFYGNFQNGKLCAVKELAGFLKPDIPQVQNRRFPKLFCEAGAEGGKAESTALCKMGRSQGFGIFGVQYVQGRQQGGKAAVFAAGSGRGQGTAAAAGSRRGQGSG